MTRGAARRTIAALVALAAALERQGRYRESEEALRRAVAAAERTFGADAPELLIPLNALAVCHTALARYVDAGLALQRALRIAERRRPIAPTDVATLYANLGALEHAAGNWPRGEPFARAAVKLRRLALGPRHVDVAHDLLGLAALLAPQRKLDEAERIGRRALAVLERKCGPRHRLVAVALNNLAAVHQGFGETSAAETLYRRALEIETESSGADHPAIGMMLNNLATLRGGKHPHDAVGIFRRALAILGRTLGPAHPHVGRVLENLAPLLWRLGRREASRAAARRAGRILGRVEAVNDEAVGLTGTISPAHARFQLVVGPSPIHRLGVFAGEPIPAHRKVIEYTGERISADEGARRWNPKRSYLFDLNRRWQIDGAIGGSGAEYINHSCAPNLRGRLVRGHILYVSVRPIAPGEELTVDYQYSDDTDRMPCSCGAPSCRGVMNLSRREARARRALRRRRR